MSLREEIRDIIYKKIGGKKDVGMRWTQCQEATNEIISNIERRIDEKINNIASTEVMDVPNSFHVMGYAAALDEIKEMLK